MEKLKAQDLRIGNLVLFDVEDVLEIITPRRLGYIAQANSKEDSHPFKPIPLTEEWLFKFGFVKNIGKHGEYYSHNVFIRFVIWVDHEGFVCGRDEVKGCTAIVESKHVHQLQNLFYALTGEELECK